MLIYVRTPKEEKEGNIHIPLWFPTILLLNHISVLIVWAVMRSSKKCNGFAPSLGQSYRLLHAVWRHKLRHPFLPFVSVDSADGVRVRIRI
jgi:hypothetical protein